MNKSLLVTRPNDDCTTNYLSFWSLSVIDEAKRKGFDIYDLFAKKANRKDFDSYLRFQKPDILFLNGHGNEKTVTGFAGETLLISSKKKPVKNTIIYARSCSAATILGSKLISWGAKAFIGYIREFIFGYTQSKITRPLEDSLARLFLEPSNLVVTTILKSHKVSEAVERSKEMMYQNFKKMISATATYEERYSASWLWSNIKNQVLYGDMDAVV